MLTQRLLTALFLAVIAASPAVFDALRELAKEFHPNSL